MSITGDWWLDGGAEIHTDTGPVRELAPMTLRVVKHELRTPINHIIGYSEMLIEDLATGSDAAALSAVQVVLAAGREMLAVVNAQIGGESNQDSVLSEGVLVSLRVAVRGCVDRVFMQQLEETSLNRSPMFSGDVQKILDATRRLAEFAETGKVPAS